MAGIRLKMVHRTVIQKYINIDIYTHIEKNIHENINYMKQNKNNIHRHVIT